MARLTLRRRQSFAAAHAYWFAEKSEAENRAVFGKWASPWGHGHNYQVDICVTGEMDERTGMVVNIVEVDAVLKRVLKPLRDKHLTYEVPYFATNATTTENIARYIAQEFNTTFNVPGAALTRITLWETDSLFSTLDFDSTGSSATDNSTLEHPLVSLTRTLDFAASHRLHAPLLSDEENIQIFDKCNNMHGHGHNYGVEVTVTGDVDPVTGMIVDLTALDKVLQTEIMARFDHKNLNHDVSDFADTNPTTENLTLVIWKHLHDKIPAPAKLHKVVVKETDRNFFEYSGD
jgi:6-pyruvoyltetrahydropterin/6-carboxytetrahydropterin synthase